MKIIGIDAGNYENKIVTIDVYRKFLSCLGEHRERKLEENYRNDDFEFEYNGRKGFAGTLARDESEWVNNRLGDSKAHSDALIRVLLSLHQVCNDRDVIHLVTGSPIEKQKQDKQDIKEMLLGQHTMTVNHVTKTLCIEAVEVAPETATAILAKPTVGRVHVVDVGAGTIGLATINDMRFVDRDSLSIETGANSTKELSVEGIVNKVLNSVYHKWDRSDKVYVIGGMAGAIQERLKDEYSDCQVMRPIHNLEALPPTFANAVGFYKLGVGIWGSK